MAKLWRNSAIATALFISTTTAAQRLGAQQASDRYTRADHMITMRDGARLNTVVWTPRDQSGPLPFLFLRTPYGVENRVVTSPQFKELADDGYIIVFQDIRGRYKSEGQFVMQHPARQGAQRTNSKAIDEATDPYP